ncbi:MAG: GNAT family N-acetyltransferase [Oscillospiraceae bacterium]
MGSFLLRPACEGDIPALVEIWAASFGDSRELAAALVRNRGLFRHGVTAEAGGQPVGCMFAFDDLGLGGQSLSYLYALCVHPEHRGRGIGAAATKYAAEEAFRRGAEAVLLRPADSGLAAWYETLGFTPLCGGENVPLEAEDPGPVPVRELSAGEYLRRRRSALGVTEELLLAQETLFRFGGGAFLEFDGRCLCAESDGGTVLIREAEMTGRELARAAGAVLRRFGARQALLRRRADAPEGEDLLSVMTRDGTPFPGGEELFFPFTLE